MLTARSGEGMGPAIREKKSGRPSDSEHVQTFSCSLRLASAPLARIASQRMRALHLSHGRVPQQNPWRTRLGRDPYSV